MVKTLAAISLGIILAAGFCLFETADPNYQVSASPHPGSSLFAQPVAPASPRQVWSIGVLTGSSPFNLEDSSNVKNPIITSEDVTDIEAEVVAHPFIVRENSNFYMFFTAKNRFTHQGEIGLAESGDGLSWRYRQIVLKTSYHLAYPYVFQWKDEYYMIPEGVDDRSVRLYRATEFPTKWTHEQILLKGQNFISASVIRHQNTWWMFVGMQGNETLRLYFAKELKGVWVEHPRSPIVERNKDTARPGGRPFIIDGSLYRLGQDCYPTYGRAVSAFRVKDLSNIAYEELLIDPPLVEATSTGWSSEGMHHVDALPVGESAWIAVVDGVQTVQ